MSQRYLKTQAKENNSVGIGLHYRKVRTCVLYLGELTFYHWFDSVIKLELWNCVAGSKLNLSNKPTTRRRCLPPPAAHAHLSNAAMWHELRLTRKHLRRHNNEGRELTENATDRTIFLKGQLRGEKKKKRWMMITWKCSITCNTLAALPPRGNCACAQKILAVRKQCRVLCVQRTNRTVQMEETQHILHISRTNNWL